MREPIFLVGDIILGFAVLEIFVFIIIYAVVSPWRSTTSGRALMYTMGSLAVLSVLLGLAILLGSDYPARPYIRIVAYALVSIAVGWMNITLLRLQLRNRKKRNR